MNHWKEVLPVTDPRGQLRRDRDRSRVGGPAAGGGVRPAWEPACLEFHRTERPVRTASVMQVRQPVYQRSVARWKHYEPALGELFAAIAAGIRAVFGGLIQHDGPAPRRVVPNDLRDREAHQKARVGGPRRDFSRLGTTLQPQRLQLLGHRMRKAQKILRWHILILRGLPVRLPFPIPPVWQSAAIAIMLARTIPHR